MALIDFDLASPGQRVWDVAAAARLWAPLRQDADVHDARHGRVLHRFRLFADAYGLTEPERAVLVDAVIANHDWLYEVVQAGARAGHAGFTDYWSAARARATRTRSWYLRATHQLRATITPSPDGLPVGPGSSRPILDEAVQVVEGDGRLDEGERRQHKPDRSSSKKENHEQYTEDLSHNRMQDKPRLVASLRSWLGRTSSRPWKRHVSH